MTNENLADLLAQLSIGAQDAAGSDLSQRPVPVHSLHRLWSMGELSAQIALAYGALWVRGWFSDAETRRKRTMEANLRVAVQLFHRLSYLRGAMAKLGQAAGHFGPVVPRDIVETLDLLHCEAPPMHYSLIREVVENEFGQGPESLFASFEREAFAAASLGQVHRARLHTGEQVAVKIQYPGIARTIGADFRNLQALLFPMRLSADWDYMKAQFEEVRTMLNREVDYRQEAETTLQARALFPAGDGVLVPRVFERYSGERVLTTEFIQGRHLGSFLAADPPQSLRDAFGNLIYKAHFRLYYALMNYADPHPGNYLFLDDGRLAMIDFGCVQRFNPEEQEILRLSERLVAEDESVIPLLLERVTGLRPGDRGADEYLEMIHRSCDWMMEPMRSEGPFDFGDEGHLRRGFAWFSRALRDRTVRGHRMYVYHHRTVFGIKSLVYRLRARVDVKGLHAAESRAFIS